ncbi:Hypothetical predicted protein [Olea europaea subsp. europaea]|uniref:Uncharacterized protein n=1 Tax=Olea europaea subsp. europaea TaxID=158383 RepID=A0A8S0US25_OLEEU|nr:Hypothetical predicted protein [Olea europaea subsp. europaea]
MNGAWLPHRHAGLGVRGDSGDWGCFGQGVDERMPRLLRWSIQKYPQHRTYDTFFKNVQLHVYTTLHPTNAEVEQPYLSTLVPYDDPLMSCLMTLVRSGRSGDGETFGDDDNDGQLGSDRDGDDSEDTGESSTPSATPVPSPVRVPTTHTRPVGTSASSLTKGKVEELLLDQRILFEMRLRTVKLEIEQHVTFECTRLREFIATQVAPPLPTTAPCSKGAIIEPGPSGCSPQERADIAPCPDVEHEPLPTPIDDQQDGAATEPSEVAVVSDAEIEGCNITDGEGLVVVVPVPVADVPLPTPVPEVRGRVSMMRWRSVRLRCPAPANRTPYMRGRGKTMKK